MSCKNSNSFKDLTTTGVILILFVKQKITKTGYLIIKNSFQESNQITLKILEIAGNLKNT